LAILPDIDAVRDAMKVNDNQVILLAFECVTDKELDFYYNFMMCAAYV
jgi:hypothetical protein